MLNLRSVDDRDRSHAATQHFSAFSAPNFRIGGTTYLGNIGEYLASEGAERCTDAGAVESEEHPTSDSRSSTLAVSREGSGDV